MRGPAAGGWRASAEGGSESSSSAPKKSDVKYAWLAAGLWVSPSKEDKPARAAACLRSPCVSGAPSRRGLAVEAVVSTADPAWACGAGLSAASLLAPLRRCCPASLEPTRSESAMVATRAAMRAAMSAGGLVELGSGWGGREGSGARAVSWRAAGLGVVAKDVCRCREAPVRLGVKVLACEKVPGRLKRCPSNSFTARLRWSMTAVLRLMMPRASSNCSVSVVTLACACSCSDSASPALRFASATSANARRKSSARALAVSSACLAWLACSLTLARRTRWSSFRRVMMRLPFSISEMLVFSLPCSLPKEVLYRARLSLVRPCADTSASRRSRTACSSCWPSATCCSSAATRNVEEDKSFSWATRCWPAASAALRWDTSSASAASALPRQSAPSRWASRRSACSCATCRSSAARCVAPSSTVARREASSLRASLAADARSAACRCEAASAAMAASSRTLLSSAAWVTLSVAVVESLADWADAKAASVEASRSAMREWASCSASSWFCTSAPVTLTWCRRAAR